MIEPLPSAARLGGSFRDPSGFVFTPEGVVYRQVNQVYRDEYEQLMGSGLYHELTEQRLLVAHEELETPADGAEGFRVLQPEPVPFISYPYEWCFSQLQDAALAVLAIQRVAIEHGMTLKDATAFNIQFLRGAPILIDTLSFARYREGEPWVAYRQFCRHFLAPLALASRVDSRLLQGGKVFLDGWPLDLASRMLPRRSWLRPGLLMHLHLHGRAEARAGGLSAESQRRPRPVSRAGLLGILDSLERTVRSLRWDASQTRWSSYTRETNYSDAAMEAKRQLVREMIAESAPRVVWDLGANTGDFSRIAAESAELTMAFDLDAGAVEQSYLRARASGEERMLPLVMDLTNPSPGLGWAHRERDALAQRPRPDLVLALAVVHHLALGNNVPLGEIARFLAEIAPHLLIEWVPKEDSQVQRMLLHREDVFEGYTREGLERDFARHYQIERRAQISDSVRFLYLMRSNHQRSK